MTKTQLASLLSVALAACTVTSSDDAPECTGGKCDGSGPSQTCDDPHYGNGTCDLQLSCGVPDIDCFRTFANDAEAGAWWAQTEKTALGENYAIIPETDPRFVRVRAALDQGWAAFKTHRPVGRLADERPALVLVDQPLAHAAFVFGDRAANNQPFVVMVETSALAQGADDDAILGVMMHELQHAVGLQKLGDISDKLRKFYIADPGTEPMGREQPDDPNVRTVAQTWMEGAAQVGPYAQVELGGMPTNGQFLTMLSNVVAGAKQAHPTECAPAVQQLNDIQSAIASASDPTDNALPADLTGLDTAVASAFQTLRDDCLAGYPYDLIAVGAALAMVTPAEFEAQLEPRDVALVKGKPFVDGLTAIVEDRRETMRTAEQTFTDGTGEAWSQLRYFSYEEDADDVSTIVMHAAGKDATAIGGFFRTLLPADARAACDQALAGLPGYGVDLTDEHHATCWRIAHNRRGALALGSARIVTPASRISVPRALHRPGTIPSRPDPRSQIAD